MVTLYRQRIQDYCEFHQIAVPLGFGRNTPGRYAVIRLDQAPPKLVAKTWSKTVDLIYFLEKVLVPEVGSDLSASVLILDFKEQQELKWNGAHRLIPVLSST